MNFLQSDERNLITDRILEDVRGNMLEDIVLIETMRTLRGRDKAVKVKFQPSGEFDMLVYRDATKDCRIYEVKHAQKDVPERQRLPEGTVTDSGHEHT